MERTSADQKIVHHHQDEIFIASSDKAVVTFFDPDEYKSEYVRVINKEWTLDHVEAFLRVIDMVQLIEPFRQENFNGYMLTALTSENPVDVALKFKMTLPECEDLFNCIDDLGGVTNLELVRMINQEFDTLRSEHMEKSKQLKRLEDNMRHRKANLPHQWQVLAQSKGVGTVDGEFDVLLFGAPGVGKTSIMKSFMLEDFDEEEARTVGVAPIEHTIGLSTLRFWDMDGCVMQSSTTTLNPKRINACLFVFDVTNRKSFEWLRVVLATHAMEKWIYSVLVCNKLDLVDDECGDPGLREVTEEDYDELADMYGIDTVIEVSAATGLRIHEAVADSILKADQIKFMAPPKKQGLKLHSSPELDWGYEYQTLHLFPCCYDDSS